MRPAREQFHPRWSGFELARGRRGDSHCIQPSQFEDLIIDLDAAAALEYDVDLLSEAVAMTPNLPVGRPPSCSG
jgi:hypothetical protein